LAVKITRLSSKQRSLRYSISNIGLICCSRYCWLDTESYHSKSILANSNVPLSLCVKCQSSQLDDEDVGSYFG